MMTHGNEQDKYLGGPYASKKETTFGHDAVIIQISLKDNLSTYFVKKKNKNSTL